MRNYFDREFFKSVYAAGGCILWNVEMCAPSRQRRDATVSGYQNKWQPTENQMKAVLEPKEQNVVVFLFLQICDLN